MYSNWIPQNIQKRVFLYILQQLSLFSGIELPNLEEVSFNNIHLRDVEIDPEKITKIPGFRLRHGTLSDVTLKGSVKDGARLEIVGVDLVVAPSIDNLREDIENAQASLAQSSADLTSTILLERESDIRKENTAEMGSSAANSGAAGEKPSPLSPSPMSEKKRSNSTSSSLGGVMSRAIDIALSKLQIRVSNVTIKVLIEPADLILQIEELVFSYKTVMKVISIKGIKVCVGKPFSNSGVTGRKGSYKPGTPEEKSQNTQNPVNKDFDSDNSDSDGSDDLENEGSESLIDSMVFTHEEASSIYMSATSQTFSATKEDVLPLETPSETIVLFHIDVIDVSFQDVSPLSNLRVDIHTVNVSAVPLLPTASIVLNSLSKLFKLTIHQLRKRRSLRKSGQNPDSKSEKSDDDSSDESEDESVDILEKFHIDKFEISLTSALEESGTFSSFDDEVNIMLANFTMKVRNENLTYGGLETFQILRYRKGEKSQVFHFDSMDTTSAEAERPAKRADIRFEHSISSDTLAELTILISRPGFCKLEASSLKYLINFFHSITAVNENMSTLLKNVKQFNDLQNSQSTPSDNSASSENSTQVILQTSSLEAELKLSEKSFIKVLVYPISFDKVQDSCTIPRINVDVSMDEIEKRVLTISDVNFYFSPQKFNSYHYSVANLARKSTWKSSTSLVVGDVTGKMTKDRLLLLLENTKTFSNDLRISNNINCMAETFANESPSKTTFSQPSNLMSSIYAGQSRFKRLNNTQIMFGEVHSPAVSVRAFINSVKFTLTDVSPAFGDFEMTTNGIEMLRLSSGMCGNITSMNIKRSHSSDSLLSHITKENPIVQFRRKGDERLVFEVVCRGFMVDYHVSWLSLLSSPKSSATVKRAEENERKMPTREQNSRDEGVDIRLIFHDFAFGMVPGRLQSKLFLTGANGSSDVSLKSDQYCMKSSFRDLRISLMDDIKSLRAVESTSSINSTLSAAGCVDIGQVNLVHVGLALSTDIESVKAKNVGLFEELAVVEVKINIDNVCLDVCADSAHTLLQTINDLKEPVLFKDEEKYRVRVNGDFALPPDVLEPLGHDGESSNQSGTVRNAKDEFCFVDEYYSERRSDGLNKRLSSVDLNSSSSASKEGSSLHLVESHFIEKEYPASNVVLPFSLVLHVKQAEAYLHDGYDWKSTRKSIKGAVQAFEKRSLELARQQKEQPAEEPSLTERETSNSDDDEPSEPPQSQKLTQTLFQSIHIETDPMFSTANLVEIINEQVRGGSLDSADAHTNVRVDKSFKDLKLKRSRSHKVSAECKNIAVKVKTYPDESDESRTSKSAIVNKAEVFLGTVDVKDNVPTSTWNRLLTYMNALGEREIGTNMLALSITNVRPDSRMPYAEAVISLRVLPLRLFVDQDTLGFVTRFFGFRDARFALPVDEILYVQKLTIDPLRIKFDYKPKSIDYAGIRSGNNAELANFFILDGSDLKLRKAVIYGAHGFPKIGRALGQIYGPYIQRYQLSGLLSGLAPVKSIINVGSGVRDLVAFPMQEYIRDGRVLYGLQKGSLSFAKTTTNELLRLGVKLASGAQVVLENSEEYFGGEGASARTPRTKTNEEKKDKDAKKPSRPKGDKRKDLLESSQILRSSVAVDPDQHSKPVQYIHSAIDEEDSEPEFGELQSSILVFNDASDDEEDDDLTELSADSERKITSLYSNQPANAKEGFRSALKAMGKNLKGSKKKFRELRRELQGAESVQEQIASVARKSPVIVIRPLIGTTEAMMKTLIGISNGLDSRSLQESHDKYRTEKD